MLAATFRSAILAGMLIYELSPAECLEVISRAYVGRLACARDDQPYIVPISFCFDGTASLYGFSRVGQKIEWMRENPKVCVETDEIVDRFHWSSVIVTGTYEELGDSPEDDSEQLKRALDLLQQHSAWWLPGAGELVDGETDPTSVVYRVRIASISGRRTARPSTSPSVGT